VQTNGSAISSSGGSNLNAAIFGQTPGPTALANTFATGVMDILDYASTSKFKTFRTFTGFNTNGTSNQFLGLYSGLWQSNAAITSLTMASNDGTGILQHSTFTLYGMVG
jgi:hypothetical protein